VLTRRQCEPASRADSLARKTRWTTRICEKNCTKYRFSRRSVVGSCFALSTARLETSRDEHSIERSERTNGMVPISGRRERKPM